MDLGCFGKVSPMKGFLPRELKEAGLIRKGEREEHCRQREEHGKGS